MNHKESKYKGKRTRHIIVNLLKTKEKKKNLKRFRKKTTTQYIIFKRTTVILMTAFSAHTMEERRQWNIFKVLKGTANI